MQIHPAWSFASLALLSLACGTGSGAERASSEQQAPLEAGFQLASGDTLCLLGGALAERMQHHGWLETSLQERFPASELRVRNLGFGADELGVQQRTANFGKFSSDGMQSDLHGGRFLAWDRYLGHSSADVIFAFFGYNESFAGEAGLPAFEALLQEFIEHVGLAKYDAQGAAQLVLFSTLPVEDMGDPNLPDGSQTNANLELYNAAMEKLARAQGLRFVDLFGPMRERYASSREHLTINGMHLNETGDRVLAEVIDGALFAGTPRQQLGSAARAALRAAVLEKNQLWFNRYRATDGYNVYGARSRLTYVGATDGQTYSNFEVLQREMDHLDGRVDARDRQIWGLAKGEATGIDDAGVLPLLSVPTNQPGEGAGGAHVYRSASQELESLSPGAGFELQLFADERQFPELVNPVQMSWDTRGRLWVACWPSYPHWQPDREMNDKLLILEDTDGDGRANTCVVFADDLHNPTGFEFWNGGVLLAAQPDLLFLKDTDGDDRADHREHLLHGLSSADTHHAANSFVIGPDGALYFQEGTFHMSQVESIYGPVRQSGACAWRFDPRTWRVERYIPYGFANPHGHVFDAWGQDFITDGTGNDNYFALAFSGHLPQPENHSRYFTFFNQHTRPAGGTEILSSRHFPAEMQGDYLIANVIGFRGIHRYRVSEAGSGFGAEELEPIVESSSQNFRPVDIEMGPDGALYFLDWHNALIGHMQHHLRDPSRDARHGRVYRVTHRGRAPLEVEPIAGRSIEELLELLKSPEDRTRYRVRLELSGRHSEQVSAAARAWVRSLDPEQANLEHHRLEALWLQQQHNRMDRELLLELLRSPDARARAAATRVLRHGRHLLPDALDLLWPQVRDEHPRVRLEAVVAASFLRGSEAVSLALEVLQQPTDKFIDYALGETMRALEADWKAALAAGESLAEGNLPGIDYLLGKVSAEELPKLPRIPRVLLAMLTRHGVSAELRRAAAEDLARLSQSSVQAEILIAMELLDASADAHADHVLLELSDLLVEVSAGAPAISRDIYLAQAEQGRHLSMRMAGYAALVRYDGSTQRALDSALQSAPRLMGLFASLERIERSDLRLQLADTLEQFMFDVPEALSRSGPGSGLDVGFYEPPPASAKREDFERLSPAQELSATHFKHDIGPALESDSFGLSFRGTLFVPNTGRYVFSTTSDDGSMLYIDGTLVVDNDGPHGAVTQHGELELNAGAHGILVNYYEQGGGDALIVRWSGPGIEEAELPADVLGSSSAMRLSQGAARAMAHLPLAAAHKVGLATRLLDGKGDLKAALTLLQGADLRELTLGVRNIESGLNSSIELLQALTEHLSQLPLEARTSASVALAIEMGLELTASMEAEQAEAIRSELQGLGGRSIVIRTLPHQMRYDLTEFEVQAGMPVSIIFQNNDMMPHNLVITLPGTLAEVGQAAEKLSGRGGSAQFIPETESVLWHTGLVMPGQSERLTFVVPERLGEHPYVCTYPGHWRVMNGIMRVVARGSQVASIERHAASQAQAEVRPFVKDWNLAELLPLLEPEWERSASVEHGRLLFEEAGCIKCHSVAGQGALGGPELTAIQNKYTSEQLLAHVIEPSQEVLPEYTFYVFEVEGQSDVIGRILKEDSTHLEILPSLLEPDEIIRLPKSKIQERFDTQLSPMPTGLLVTLTSKEILDLLAFLQTPIK